MNYIFLYNAIVLIILGTIWDKKNAINLLLKAVLMVSGIIQLIMCLKPGLI